MSKIPEGVETTTAEGRDVEQAVVAAAAALGVERRLVAHTLDMSHFRNPDGRMVPRDTVKVIAWVDPNGGSAEVARPARAAPRDDGERRERRDDDGERRPPRERRDDGERRASRDRRDDGERRAPRERRDDGPSRRGAEVGTTEASDFAQAWFKVVLDHLEVPGTVEATGSADRVHLRVLPTDKAGRLIGRRGTTLAAIRHLLACALERFGSFVIDVDVDDERGADGGRDRDRDGDRDRDRDRDGGRRGEGRGESRDKARPRRSESDGMPEDKLRALARRAAEKALETGKPITINLPLSSYERRIIHVEITDIAGVATRSVEKGEQKVVQVIPE
jgi:spoIIIJ-associated protein